MTPGFRVRAADNSVILDSSSHGFSLVELLTVDPTTSGSRTYEELGDVEVFTTQSQVEPTTSDVATLLRLSAVNVVVATVGRDKVVSWSPRFTFGAPQNVNIYVMAM